MQMIRPRYETSHALIIGIDKYRYDTPLGYSFSDATAVSDVLRDRFGFRSENIAILLDDNATRDRINEAIARTAETSTHPDDRLFVFFAGHGMTFSSSVNEVGYLVPVDGDCNNRPSLIRWDSFLREADFAQAKHKLFVMDACYSGLAFSRALQAGASRFLKDILTRKCVQVLTAGKADQTVSDSGGPRSSHSVFTGHLLDALEGEGRFG